MSIDDPVPLRSGAVPSDGDIGALAVTPEGQTSTAGPVAAGDALSVRSARVHQAVGMILVQLGVSAGVAFVRLRGYADAHDRSLDDVAGDVVERRLRFDPDQPSGSHPTPGS